MKLIWVWHGWEQVFGPLSRCCQLPIWYHFGCLYLCLLPLPSVHNSLLPSSHLNYFCASTSLLFLRPLSPNRIFPLLLQMCAYVYISEGRYMMMHKNNKICIFLILLWSLLVSLKGVKRDKKNSSRCLMRALCLCIYLSIYFNLNGNETFLELAYLIFSNIHDPEKSLRAYFYYNSHLFG